MAANYWRMSSAPVGIQQGSTGRVGWEQAGQFSPFPARNAVFRLLGCSHPWILRALYLITDLTTKMVLIPLLAHPPPTEEIDCTFKMSVLLQMTSQHIRFAVGDLVPASLRASSEIVRFAGQLHFGYPWSAHPCVNKVIFWIWVTSPIYMTDWRSIKQSNKTQMICWNDQSQFTCLTLYWSRIVSTIQHLIYKYHTTSANVNFHNSYVICECVV